MAWFDAGLFFRAREVRAGAELERGGAEGAEIRSENFRSASAAFFSAVSAWKYFFRSNWNYEITQSGAWFLGVSLEL